MSVFMPNVSNWIQFVKKMPRTGQLKRISKCLVQIWLMRNLKRPFLRGAIHILYALGLALIAIPAVFTFGQVSLVAVKRVLE